LNNYELYGYFDHVCSKISTSKTLEKNGNVFVKKLQGAVKVQDHVKMLI